MLLRIRTDQLRVGMYLHAVDATWLQNPFWRSRFLLKNTGEIARLRDAGIATATIDLSRGLGPSAETTPTPVDPPTRPPASAYAVARDEAAAVIARSKDQMKRVFEDARLGHAIESAAVRAVVDDIAGSVRASPQALLGMLRLKTKDEYTYLHSVAVCALMVNLARTLGLDEPAVRDLGLAGLVHDIGKMAVPNAILNKPGRLDDAEFDVVRTHPERGGEMLLQAEDMPDVAFDVCRHHHEKVDGTGYPRRLKGDEISLAARKGAVCDVYDALTSDRAYKDGWTPAEATAAMHGWTGQFDPQILFAFFQSIAVLPPGLLVRMRSGHLAVTLPNGRRASRPRLRLFYDIGGEALIRPRDLVLSGSEASRDIAVEEDAAAWPVHDWTRLREHLLGEADALDPATIGRLWYAPPSEAERIVTSPRTRLTAWRPGELQ